VKVVLERHAHGRAVRLEAAPRGGRLANGWPIGLPSRENVTRSGVNGLAALNLPPNGASSLLLQRPGSPVPDSITCTLKRLPSPWKAIAVGKLRSFAKTSTL
jgi:hypothetical protein